MGTAKNGNVMVTGPEYWLHAMVLLLYRKGGAIRDSGGGAAVRVWEMLPTKYKGLTSPKSVSTLFSQQGHLLNKYIEREIVGRRCYKFSLTPEGQKLGAQLEREQEGQKFLKLPHGAIECPNCFRPLHVGKRSETDVLRGHGYNCPAKQEVKTYKDPSVVRRRPKQKKQNSNGAVTPPAEVHFEPVGKGSDEDAVAMKIATALLAKVLEKAKEPKEPKAPKADFRRVEMLERQLRETKQKLSDAESNTSTLLQQIEVLSKQNSQLQGQVEHYKKNSGGSVLGNMLKPDQLAQLNDLAKKIGQ